MAEDFRKIAAEVAAGLGEVGLFLTIVRSTPGTPDPTKPWEPVTPSTTKETIAQFGDGSGKYRKDETIVSTDFEFMTAVPATITPQPGDTIEVDGVHHSTIVRAEAFPPTGHPAYITIWSNR